MLVETQLLRLSQAQLNSLEKCPRLFQHKHVEQLYSFTNPEHEAKQALGSKFHLLMQQREMGLPIDGILADDPQLSAWIQDFGEVAPEIFAPNLDPQIFRESEHYRTLQVDAYLFTVIYDLLILDPHRAQIIDWKTYPQPPSKRRLENSWQTKLYLFALAQTTNYPPENISMTYWFFQTGTKPTCSTIKYSRTLHEQIKRKLNRLLGQLTEYFAAYNAQKQFPQVPEGSKLCHECVFANRCDRAILQEAAVGSMYGSHSHWEGHDTTPSESRLHPDQLESKNPESSDSNSPHLTTLNQSLNVIDHNLLSLDSIEEVCL